MPTLLQINTTCNSASHGRIAEQIGQLVIKNGWKSYIAFGRGNPKSQSETYKICSDLGLYKNVILARIFDNDGFCFGNDTQKLIGYIERIKPTIVHLHNLHGYYLNIQVLFEYLAKQKIPIVWTLHDCWPITGHCSHFEYIGCEKWEKQCMNCSQKKQYPASFMADESKRHHSLKRRLFSALQNLRIVTPSDWLKNILEKSYLQKFPVTTINNGIDITLFKPEQELSILKQYNLQNKRIILGVPSQYSLQKCIDEFIRLSHLLQDNCLIVLIGLTKRQLNTLPSNVLGIERTQNKEEMVAWYSRADVFVNTTLEDTFPTTNLEALACGTPVITYATGGSVESVSSNTGFIVPQNDIMALKDRVEDAIKQGKIFYRNSCVKRVNDLYDSKKQYDKYVGLYNSILGKTK